MSLESVQLGLAEDPVGFGLQIIDLRTDPCSLAPHFSMRAVITEPAEVETRHRIRVCERAGLMAPSIGRCLWWKIPPTVAGRATCDL